MKNFAKGLTYSTYGNPLDVINLSEIETLLQPAPGMLRLRMEFAPIHPSDFGLIEGTYGRLRSLTAFGGREGVGIVRAVGKDVSRDWIEKRCVVLTDQGTWRTEVDVPVQDCIPVCRNLSSEQASMSIINPCTAWMLLHEFVTLNSGDWIVQNAANSSVGQLVVQMAKKIGFKTLCVVREGHGREMLENLGADVVIDDIKGWSREVESITKREPVRLAFNSVGGQSVLDLIGALDPEGTCVTFGGMSKDLIRFPTRDLIFKALQLKGFWFEKWFLETEPKKKLAFIEKILSYLESSGLVSAISGVYLIAEYQKALTEARRPGLCGKVLFCM
jgi:mitochondrial enoyl-[acyl-carrier protein] reductase / trans-2-enoyl-CoA reductase